MNKNGLITTIAASADLSKPKATQVLEGILNTISNTLSSGGDVRLAGFGTFSVSTRKASIGRNPRTGEIIHLSEIKIPKFKAGTVLKRAVK